MSLDRILEAVESVRESSEPFGVLIGGTSGHHVVRVLVGREVVAHVEAPSRDEAVARAVEVLSVEAEASSGQCAFAAAGTW